MKKAIFLLLFLLAYSAGAQGYVKEFEKAFGPSLNYNPSNLLQTRDGGFLLLSTIKNSTDIEFHGKADVLLIKIDNKGEEKWKKYYGGSYIDKGVSIIETTDNCFIIGANTTSNDIDVPYNNGSYDYWVFKIDSIGNIIWSKVFGGDKQEVLSNISYSVDGGFIIAGTTSSSNSGDVGYRQDSIYDAWIVKINSEGHIKWDKCIGGSKIEIINDVKELLNQNILIAGFSPSNDRDIKNNHGSADAILIKLDKDGKIILSNTYGGSQDDIGKDILIYDSTVVFAISTTSNDGDISFKSEFKELYLFEINNDGIIKKKNRITKYQDHDFNEGITLNNIFIYLIRYATPSFHSSRLVLVDRYFSTRWEHIFDRNTLLTNLSLTQDSSFACLGLRNDSLFFIKFKPDPTAISKTINTSLLSYPNPFSDATEIKFKLDEAAKVDIRIHNSIGSLVFSSSTFFGAGENSFKWNADSLPSGAYLCRISYNDNLQYSYILKK